MEWLPGLWMSSRRIFMKSSSDPNLRGPDFTSHKWKSGEFSFEMLLCMKVKKYFSEQLKVRELYTLSSLSDGLDSLSLLEFRLSETWHMTYLLSIIYWHLQNKHQVQMIWHDYDCGPTLHLLLTRLCVGGAASDQFYVLLSWVIKYSNILNIHPCVTWPECPPDLHHGGRYRPGSVSPQVTLGQYCGNLGHTMHPPPTPTPPS